MDVPQSTLNAIASQGQETVPEFATQCFMLSNMVDSYGETEAEWDLDVRDDVIEECRNHGGKRWSARAYEQVATPTATVAEVTSPSIRRPNERLRHNKIRSSLERSSAANRPTRRCLFGSLSIARR